jgi:hypothetical protein
VKSGLPPPYQPSLPSPKRHKKHTLPGTTRFFCHHRLPQKFSTQLPPVPLPLPIGGDPRGPFTNMASGYSRVRWKIKCSCVAIRAAQQQGWEIYRLGSLCAVEMVLGSHLVPLVEGLHCVWGTKSGLPPLFILSSVVRKIKHIPQETKHFKRKNVNFILGVNILLHRIKYPVIVCLNHSQILS